MPGKRATLHHQDICHFSCIILLQIHTSEHMYDLRCNAGGARSDKVIYNKDQ